MQFSNRRFGESAEPFRFSPFTSSIEFPATPPTSLIMITESGDPMITESTNDNMVTE
jgi:hypothetical protein